MQLRSAGHDVVRFSRLDDDSRFRRALRHDGGLCSLDLDAQIRLAPRKSVEHILLNADAKRLRPPSLGDVKQLPLVLPRDVATRLLPAADAQLKLNLLNDVVFSST